jgi:hypothetical protein
MELISSCACDIGDYRSVLAKKRVKQTAFSDIWATDKGHSYSLSQQSASTESIGDGLYLC